MDNVLTYLFLFKPSTQSPSVAIFLANLGDPYTLAAGMNLLRVKLTINQSSPANYTAEVFTLQPSSAIKFCRPRLNTLDANIGYALDPTGPSRNTLNISPGAIFYEGKPVACKIIFPNAFFIRCLEKKIHGAINLFYLLLKSTKHCVHV